jgi:hypothetical protein
MKHVLCLEVVAIVHLCLHASWARNTDSSRRRSRGEPGQVRRGQEVEGYEYDLHSLFVSETLDSPTFTSKSEKRKIATNLVIPTTQTKKRPHDKWKKDKKGMKKERESSSNTLDNDQSYDQLKQGPEPPETPFFFDIDSDASTTIAPAMNPFVFVPSASAPRSQSEAPALAPVSAGTTSIAYSSV